MSDEIVKKAETGIAVSKWDEQLAAAAKEAADVEEAGGSFIGLQAGQLTVHGESVKDNKLRVVVLDSIYENVYYEGKYNPKDKKPPVCFAFSPDGENMRPHPDSSKPQCESCDNCPKNAWKSAEDGDGKACKNIRRLGLISAEISPAEVPTTEVMYLKTPVTSTKAWGVYVKTLNAMFARPPFGVVTEISTVPDKKHQFHVTFKPVGLLTDDWLEPVMQKRPVVQESIAFPYQPQNETVPADDGKPKKF